MTHQPLLMGVLNATPDSFFDGGKYTSLEKGVQRAAQMIREGADLLDIGGESARPGSDPVSEAEELRRVIPLINEIRRNFEIPISIDTYKPKVAEEAARAGATLINDITGVQDPKMRRVAREYNTDLCVMHMKGKPKTMQVVDPLYPEGVVTHLLEWFERQIDELVDFGIEKEKIILDPGIGFGKTVKQNLEIIHHLDQFKSFGLRVLIGASRKSFLGKILEKETQDRLPATLAIHTIVLVGGADLVRVHDISEHRDVIDLISRMRRELSNP